MNKWNGIGNLTKDIELKQTPSGVAVAQFTIAVSRRYTNADGQREADFIDCVAWRNQAENLAKYCHKGDKLAVAGTLQVRTYEAQDGTKRKITEIIADEVEFIKTNKNGENSGDFKPKKPYLQEVDDDGDIPF